MTETKETRSQLELRVSSLESQNKILLHLIEAIAEEPTPSRHLKRFSKETVKEMKKSLDLYKELGVDW